jgi:hypothetical protein
MTLSTEKDGSQGPQNARVVFRRLLLAKQLFLHGLDHSKRTGALNKMIAVHNFHNAIEVALRSIFLRYEIRGEKQLNIEFEAMLNEIDNHELFKKQAIRLPYRQELRNLNQMRNLIQHHAVEPETAMMEEWRVFTRRALETICETYFNIQFGTLTPLDMIDDPDLRDLMRLCFSELDNNRLREALVIATVAYKWAEQSVLGSMANPALSSTPQFEKVRNSWEPQEDDSRWKDLGRALTAINEKLQDVSTLSALFSSGVNLADRKKFRSNVPNVVFAMSGRPTVQMVDRPLNRDDVSWVLNFVLETVVDWQTLGLNPAVPEWGAKSARELAQNTDALTLVLFTPPGA